MSQQNGTAMNKSDKLPTFTHEQLREALLHIHDKLDRCLLPYVVLGNTAKHIVNNDEELTGDEEIRVGILKRELTRNSLGMLKDLIPNLEVSELQLSYFHENVPVVIDVIHGEYKVFENPDTKFYWIENFRVPNPFKLYWQQRNFIK